MSIALRDLKNITTHTVSKGFVYKIQLGLAMTHASEEYTHEQARYFVDGGVFGRLVPRGTRGCEKGKNAHSDGKDMTV